MPDTAVITYTHADATTMDLFAESATIVWQFPNKSIERQPNKIGITVDANQPYRVVECNVYLTGAQLNTLGVTDLMPAAAPTYDATDPKILVNLNGSVSWTILCAITGLEARLFADDKWACKITFTERST